MKCSYCGAELSDNRKYCLYCGAKQEQWEQTAFGAEGEKKQTVTEPQSIPAAEPRVFTKPVRQTAVPPRIQLPAGRGLGKMFFLGILTLGIYPTVIWSRIVTELNLAASRYDGKRTMPYFAMCTLAPVTLGIYVWVWFHEFCGRVGAELDRRGIHYHFGAKTFWLWGVLGSLILVGPFIFVHKLMKSMNLINEDFNRRG